MGVVSIGAILTSPTDIAPHSYQNDQVSNADFLIVT